MFAESDSGRSHEEKIISNRIRVAQTHLRVLSGKDTEKERKKETSDSWLTERLLWLREDANIYFSLG